MSGSPPDNVRGSCWWRTMNRAMDLLPAAPVRRGGNHAREPGRLPGVEPAGQIGDIAKAGAAQQAGGDRTAIAALAVHHQQFRPGPVRRSAPAVAPSGIRTESSIAPRAHFSRLPHVEHGDPIRFLFPQFDEILNRDLRNVLQLVAALRSNRPRRPPGIRPRSRRRRGPGAAATRAHDPDLLRR